MTAIALLFTLACIGISESVYLIRKKIAGERPVCVLGEECHRVLESKYNRLFGIPNEIPGLIFNVAIAFVSVFLVIGIGPMMLWKSLAEILIATAVILSLFLIFIQWRVIRVWCFWCLMAAATVFLMAIIVLTAELII